MSNNSSSNSVKPSSCCHHLRSCILVARRLSFTKLFNVDYAHRQRCYLTLFAAQRNTPAVLLPHSCNKFETSNTTSQPLMVASNFHIGEWQDISSIFLYSIFFLRVVLYMWCLRVNPTGIWKTMPMYWTVAIGNNVSTRPVRLFLHPSNLPCRLFVREAFSLVLSLLLWSRQMMRRTQQPDWDHSSLASE